MRRSSFIVILLFCSLFFISCTNAGKYYEEGNYIKALQYLDNKKGMTKSDYLMKIDCLINLGRKEEARESVMLYLLLSDESEERSYVVDLYSDYEFSDVLNVLLLKDTDGLNAQIIRYISYVNLHEYDKALDILSEKLSSQLSITQFATLLVAHPVEKDYVLSFFKAWYKALSDNDKQTFYSLYFYFIKSDLSENTAKEALEFMNSFDSDDFFKSSDIAMAVLYKNKGLLCRKLHDNRNASVFFRKSYSLNPDDEEIKELVL